LTLVLYRQEIQEKAAKVEKVASTALANPRELHNQELQELDFSSQLVESTDF
jgi:hypothetical protein